MIRSAIALVQTRFKRVTHGARDRFGPERQALACAGELAELGALLIRYGSGRKVDVVKVREEIADVLITLEQMAQIFFFEADTSKATLFGHVLTQKLDKLEHVVMKEEV